MSAIPCVRRTSIAKRQLPVRARYRGIRPIPLCSNLLLIAHNLGGKNEGKLTNVRAPSDSCRRGRRWQPPAGWRRARYGRRADALRYAFADASVVTDVASVATIHSITTRTLGESCLFCGYDRNAGNGGTGESGSTRASCPIRRRQPPLYARVGRAPSSARTTALPADAG